MNHGIQAVQSSVQQYRAPIVGLAIVFLAGFPLVFGSFQTSLVTKILLFGIFALGYNIVFGYTGLLSFGHAAYFGVGAYTVAMVLSDGVPVIGGQVSSLLPALVLAVLGSALAAAIFGAICVQRDDIQFAMLTLVFNIMLYYVALQWRSVTNGDDGVVVGSVPIKLGFISFDSTDTALYYYLVLGIFLVSTYFLWRLVNSPYGEILIALRENPERAAFVGLPVKFYKWSGFVISGAMAGLAGGLISVRLFVISPGTFHWTVSAEPILMALLGGPQVFLGPLLGAILFVGLEELLVSVIEHWEIVLGIILIPLILFLPGGILGYLTSGQAIESRDSTAMASNDEEETKTTSSNE